MLLITSKFNDLVESNKIPEVGTNVSIINCDKNIHVSINKINKSLLESNEYDIVKFNTEIESCDNLFVANITKTINEPPGKNIIRAFVCKKGDTVELMSVYKFDSNIKSWDKLR